MLQHEISCLESFGRQVEEIFSAGVVKMPVWISLEDLRLHRNRHVPVRCRQWVAVGMQTMMCSYTNNGRDFAGVARAGHQWCQSRSPHPTTQHSAKHHVEASRAGIKSIIEGSQEVRTSWQPVPSYDTIHCGDGMMNWVWWLHNSTRFSSRRLKVRLSRLVGEVQGREREWTPGCPEQAENYIRTCATVSVSHIRGWEWEAVMMTRRCKSSMWSQTRWGTRKGANWRPWAERIQGSRSSTPPRISASTWLVHGGLSGTEDKVTVCLVARETAVGRGVSWKRVSQAHQASSG